MWWQSSRLDRIEASLEASQQRIERIESNIDRLAEISEAKNWRIDRRLHYVVSWLIKTN